jgi:hypothetical protein
MKIFSSPKRRVMTAAVVVVVVLALFLVRPGAARLKARITNSISRAVARPADISSVHLRFLPRPGFDLDNLVIYEDPAFGAEPMLRATKVTAVVRLTSLLRGRLDIARLDLDEPSLNLVRRADGRWNWDDLLERTERTPLAPTSKSRAETRPGFPYIEASLGRINFKSGPEKKPYTLLNADFALWQESENTWGVRLQANPLRTDMSLTDAGLLRMNGIWQRAGSLRETPLQFSLEWDRAQLGQLTKLVSGNDKGWRGEVRLDAALSGIPAAMQVKVDTSIENFHRYDIPSSAGLRLRAHCDGKFSSVEAAMHEILCKAPVGDGMITLRGDAGLPGAHKIDLALSVESVPVGAAAELARRAKKDLPTDLVSTGKIQGAFSMKEDGATLPGAEFDGHGEIVNLRLRSTSANVELALGSIPFALSSGRASIHSASKSKSVRSLETEILPGPDELHIEYGPFPVALGQVAPAQVRGWVGRSGYAMGLRGDGEVSRALRLAGLLGLPAVKANVEGMAEMKLQIAGNWASGVSASTSGFSLPAVTGTVQLRNVRASVRGVNGPIEIRSAEMQLLRDEVRVEKLSAQAADAHWTGSVNLPRGCGMPGACLVQFNLATDDVGLGELSKWLSSQPSRRQWYQMLTSAEPAAPTFLEHLRASGKISADHLRIHGVVAEKVSGSLDLDHGKMKISDLRADLLGGKHRGDWLMDFTLNSPVYKGAGTLTGISLQQMAGVMHDPWISGTGAGTYQLAGSGTDSAGFWHSAEGTLQFDVREGVLSHVSLASAEGPLRIVRGQGRAHMKDGKIEVEKARLVTSGAAYEISGTASLGRVLDFTLSAGADLKSTGALVYGITGTVAEPHVVLISTPETQARLKP